MSYLLFLDESGHDHKTMPYEVRGGVAIHVSEVWSFICAIQELEKDCFGTGLHEFRQEIKGCKLLDKDRFKWAGQSEPLLAEDRRRYCRSFLTKGLEKKSPVKDEFLAYGQACLEMARGVFRLLRNHDAVLFAAAIPRDVIRPRTVEVEAYLRKDHVFLLQRFFDFLEQKQEYGLLVMDEHEKAEDRRFVGRLQRYFTHTKPGQERLRWIVPAPFFVSSDMTYPIQAADLAIYCINWCFRIPKRGMDAVIRHEVAELALSDIQALQFRGRVQRGGNSHLEYGITYVPDPYQPRNAQKNKETTLLEPPESSS